MSSNSKTVGIAPAWSARSPSPYAQREIAHWPGWGKAIAWDVFLNNLSAGLFVVAMAGGLLAPDRFSAVFAVALPLALLIVLVDLAVLVLDLGDPWRFLHMLRVFRRRSPMSVGTWSLSLYTPLLAIASLVQILRWPWLSGVQAWLAQAGAWPFMAMLGQGAALLALLPALGVLLYKGVLFSCTSQPGLRDARWLAAHLAPSALMLGAAALTLVAAAMGEATALALLRLALIGLLIVGGVTLGCLARNLAARARVRYSASQRRGLLVGIAMGGGLLPLALLLTSQEPVCLGLAAALVLAGGVWVRHGVILLASPPGGAGDR